MLFCILNNFIGSGIIPVFIIFEGGTPSKIFINFLFMVGCGWWVVGWRSCLTQCRTVTEVKHGRARSGVGWVTAQVIDQ